MKAVAITPLQKNSARLIEQPEPRINDDGQVLVKVLDAGVCRTDLEINEGLYGEAPIGSDYLILGHESLGVVEDAGLAVEGFSKGDYVVRVVRRACKDKCSNCSAGLIDMCPTGNYEECGIKELHGVMTEKYVDKPEYLVRIHEQHRDVAVLLEPLSVVVKAIDQACKIQERLEWAPKRAMVLGAGPIGLLQAMILRLGGMETYVVARSEKGNIKSEIAEAIGAEYVSTRECPLEKFIQGEEKFDYILEATGYAPVIPTAWKALSNNGAFCLSSVTGGDKNISFPINEINLETVLGNKVVYGTVNANYGDYLNGNVMFSDIKARWPGVLEKIISRRVPVDKFEEGLDVTRDDIKVVIDFDD